MPRKPPPIKPPGLKREPAAIPAAPPPHRIHPTAVYTLAAAARALGLRRHTLPREVRAGRLRVCKRAGAHYVLGRWLLEWLEAGEVTGQAAAG
jgi:hypothetical protein